MNKTLALTLTALLACCLAPAARAETRAVELSAAFRPHGLNNVAPSTTAPVAFVGSRETDTLYAFDPRSGAELSRLEVGDGPMHVELLERPGSRLLAVTCDGFYGEPNNFIAFVDATDPSRMSVVGRADLPPSHIFLFGASSLRFVDGGAAVAVVATNLDTAGGLVLVYDVATGTERGRTAVDFVPSSLAIVEAGERVVAAVAHATAPRGRVTLLDLTDTAAPAVTARIKLPRKAALYNINDVALAADGRYAYVASGDANALFTIDVAAGRVVSRAVTGAFPTFVRAFRVGGRDRVAVVAENASAVSFFDASEPGSPSLAGVYDAPPVFLDVRPAVSPDGRTFYAPTTDGNRLYAVDTETASLRYTSATGSYPTGVAVWSCGDEPYVCVAASRSSDVTVFPESSTGYNPKRFATAAGAVQFTLYQNVALAPGGDVAFVASKSTNELLAIDVAAAAVAGRIQVGGAPSQIAVAEDASGRRRVAVVGAESATVTIVDATDPRAMTAETTVRLESPFPFLLEYSNVVVSGDGRYAFVADGNQFVHAVDLVSGEIVATVGSGFNPVTLAIHEARGARQIAALNMASGASSVALLDASSPEAMRAVAVAELPDDLIVALNNVPRFTPDGRYVLVGASISGRMLSIDAERGTIAGSVASSAVTPAPFVDGETRLFAAMNLGADPGQIYRLKKTGAPRAARELGPLDGGFFLVGNDPIVAPDGSWGYIPNYGRASLVAFDPRTGALAGELPLGLGPGAAAVDPASGRVAAVEVNGTASRVLLADLADLGPVGSKAPAPRAARRRDGRTDGSATLSEAGRTAAPRLAAFSTDDRRLLTWNRTSNRR
jgi:DNA-binding beta-propeller fold protein YncE